VRDIARRHSKLSIVLLIERFLQRLIVGHPTYFLRTLIEASKGKGSEQLNASISDAVIEIFSNRENSHSDVLKLGQSVGGQIVFGQEGEDILLTRIFGNKANGFFVDIGAHHPTRFSNTYMLSLNGWSGINIDANQHSINQFELTRSRDINICSSIGEIDELRKYFCFAESALNTFDEEIAQMYVRSGYELDRIEWLNTTKLKVLLDANVKPGTAIDLLNIDVEGLELEVIRSNDWRKYAPVVVVVEILNVTVEQAIEHEVTKTIQSYGYVLSSKLFNSCIYVKSNT
jgi:hypothetical protein